MDPIAAKYIGAGLACMGLGGAGATAAHHSQRLAIALGIVEAVLLALGQVGILAFQLGRGVRAEHAQALARRKIRNQIPRLPQPRPQPLVP